MTDREAATKALAKSIECIAFVDRLHRRHIALEARQRETDMILEEVLVLLAGKFPELRGE
jgi:hypothetical protein